MRNEAIVETPELFTPEVMAAETPVGNQAMECVGGTCNAADIVRNSPDAANFQS